MDSKYPMTEEPFAKRSKNQDNKENSLGIRTGNLRSAKCKPSMKSQRPSQETNGWLVGELPPCVMKKEGDSSSKPFSINSNPLEEIEQMTAFIILYEQKAKSISARKDESEVMKVIDEAATFRKYITDLQSMAIKILWSAGEVSDELETDENLLTYLARAILSPFEPRFVKSEKSDKCSSAGMEKSKTSKAKSDSYVEKLVMKARSKLERKPQERKLPTDKDFDRLTKEFIVNLCKEIVKQIRGSNLPYCEMFGKRNFKELDETERKKYVNLVQSALNDPFEIDEKSIYLKEKNSLFKIEVDHIQQSSTFKAIKCFINHLTNIDAKLWIDTDSKVRGESNNIKDLVIEVIKAFRNTELEGHRIYLYYLQGMAELAIKYSHSQTQVETIKDSFSMISSDTSFPDGIFLQFDVGYQDRTSKLSDHYFVELLKSNDRRVLHGLRFLFLMIKNNIELDHSLTTGLPRIDEDILILQVCVAINNEFQIIIFWTVLKNLLNLSEKLKDFSKDIQNKVASATTPLKDDSHMVIKIYKSELQSERSIESHQFGKENLLKNLLDDIRFKHKLQFAFDKLHTFMDSQPITAIVNDLRKAATEVAMIEQYCRSTSSISGHLNNIVMLYDSMNRVFATASTDIEQTFSEEGLHQIANAISEETSIGKIYKMIGLSASSDNLLGKLDDSIDKLKTAIDKSMKACLKSCDDKLIKGPPLELIENEEDRFFKSYKKLDELADIYNELIFEFKNLVDHIPKRTTLKENNKEEVRKNYSEYLVKIDNFERQMENIKRSAEEDISALKSLLKDDAEKFEEHVNNKCRNRFYISSSLFFDVYPFSRAISDLKESTGELKNLFEKYKSNLIKTNFTSFESLAKCEAFEKKKRSLRAEADGSLELASAFLQCRMQLHCFFRFGASIIKDVCRCLPSEIQFHFEDRNLRENKISIFKVSSINWMNYQRNNCISNRTAR